MLYVLGLYAVMSLLTFICYAWDKRCARLGKSRVPEATLHGLELLGGWPGGLLGQRILRHKSVKVTYLVWFWLIVAVHAGAWVLWWMYR